jgi:hypothetical protein
VFKPLATILTGIRVIKMPTIAHRVFVLITLAFVMAHYIGFSGLRLTM